MPSYLRFNMPSKSELLSKHGKIVIYADKFY